MRGLQVGLLVLAVLMALSGITRLMSDSSSAGGWLTFGGGGVAVVVILVAWLRSRRGSE
jgi:hypothetical protein